MRAACVALVIIAVLLGVPVLAAAVECQHMAIPSYFYPGGLWKKSTKAAGAVEIMVMNPDSGVGSEINPDYVNAVQKAQAAGILVIGYVYTSYGLRPAADVLDEIATYMDWYGVDGVFLDEVASGAHLVPYYQQFADVVHSTSSLVVLNPGTHPDEAYMAVGDIVLTFEGTFQEYRNLSVPSWVWNHAPGKFWHVVYGASSSTRMRSALGWSQQRNVGYMYVTNDVLDNPWDSLPSYFSGEIDELKKSCP